MPSGIEVFDPDGRLIMDGAGRYPRIVEIIDLATAGTPGAREYPALDPESLGFVLFQGGGRARVVTQEGQRISWGFANNYNYHVFAGPPRIVVVSG